MSYGVPLENLPVTHRGSLKVDVNRRWINKRKAKEKVLRKHGWNTSNFSGMDLPGRNDVLLGRGKPMRSHCGNQKLRELVEQHRQEYDSGKFGQKAQIAEKLVQKMLKDGGQFVKQDKDGWWVAASKEERLEKVSQLFRSFRTTTSSTSSSSSSETKVRSKIHKIGPEENIQNSQTTTSQKGLMTAIVARNGGRKRHRGAFDDATETNNAVCFCGDNGSWICGN